VRVHRDTLVVESFFGDFESVVGNAGGINKSVISKKCCTAFRVSWNAVDV